MSPTRLLMVAAALTLSASGAFAQDVIYRQTFGTPVGQDQQPMATIGWQTWTGNGTANAQLASNAQSSRGNATGRPTDLDNVNAGPTIDQANGVGFVASGNGTNDLLSYTNAYVLDRSAYSLSSFTWWAASQYSLDFQRVVIQIGSTWYASTHSFAPPAIGSAVNFNTQAQQFTTSFTTTATDWQLVNFTPGSPLSLGSVLSSDLPSGNITAFGLYVELGNFGGSSITDERSRFDTFTVLANPVTTTVVPEASTLALAATAILPGIAALRLRRRRSA